MKKIYQNLSSGGKSAGFTLIELLVVVLIIGILAAVALPQYQTAVARSRYQQLVLMGTAIAKAEEVYYMANGEYTTDFSALDLDFGESKIGENDSGTFNAIRSQWGSCVLRDYHKGDIQCSSPYTGVPGFEVNFSSSSRYCNATESKGDIAHRICKLETNTKEPLAIFASYVKYKYK